MNNLTHKNLIAECWNKALYSYGTAQIFGKRATSLRKKMRITAFFGLVVPLLFGSVALSFGTKSPLLDVLLPITGIVVAGQLVMSLWGLIAKWDDEYGYSLASMKANTHLWHKWGKLAKNQQGDFQSVFDNLSEMYHNQDLEDTQKGITDKEKRFAMRSSLFQFKRECATCNKVPTSMKPSDCDTCGNY
jgi:mobilome CxxCx(11)CxxC protein